MSEGKPNPTEPHVFREVVMLPLTSPAAVDLTVGGGGYTPPVTPVSVAPRCGVCHRSREDRLHIAAEANDSERWPL